MVDTTLVTGAAKAATARHPAPARVASERADAAIERPIVLTAMRVCDGRAAASGAGAVAAAAACAAGRVAAVDGAAVGTGDGADGARAARGRRLGSGRVAHAARYAGGATSTSTRPTMSSAVTPANSDSGSTMMRCASTGTASSRTSSGVT